jgi:hypothetical protein
MQYSQAVIPVIIHTVELIAPVRVKIIVSLFIQEMVINDWHFGLQDHLPMYAAAVP